MRDFLLAIVTDLIPLYGKTALSSSIIERAIYIKVKNTKVQIMKLLNLFGYYSIFFNWRSNFHSKLLIFKVISLDLADVLKWKVAWITVLVSPVLAQCNNEIIWRRLKALPCNLWHLFLTLSLHFWTLSFLELIITSHS